MTMTVWATDEEGQVQIEIGIDSKQFWLSFNKQTSVLVREPRLIAER